ncbi:hypothetical protein ACFO3J_01050 [Streptomyces polygonati]|uniref:Integral membrane protein n=1 Tax=Streptomyces polygonati TaxID=1617087 RepID=A0ABV8HDP8_9ACTN
MLAVAYPIGRIGWGDANRVGLVLVFPTVVTMRYALHSLRHKWPAVTLGLCAGAATGIAVFRLTGGGPTEYSAAYLIAASAAICGNLAFAGVTRLPRRRKIRRSLRAALSGLRRGG